MDFFTGNLLAVLVAAVVAFIIGFLWHGPLFGKQWIRLMEIPQSEVDAMQAKGMGPMIPHMAAAFIQQLVIAGVMAHLATALTIVDAAGAIMLAVLLWIGFIVTVQLNGVLWEKRKLNLYFFNITYHLVVLVVVALIVVMWQ